MVSWVQLPGHSLKKDVTYMQNHLSLSPIICPSKTITLGHCRPERIYVSAMHQQGFRHPSPTHSHGQYQQQGGVAHLMEVGV